MSQARILPPLSLILLFAAGLGVVLALRPVALPSAEVQTTLLVLVTVGLWATGLIPESLTALMFFTVAMLAKLAPPEVVFAGLVSSAFWLVLSGLIIGAAIRHTGLGDRIAARLAALLGRTYGGAMVGVVLFGLAMAFLMPSAMGRIALMLPILSALAEHLGQANGSKGHHGLVLGGIFGTYLPSSAILPANVPNNVLAGLVETNFGHPLAFGDYLLVHFPVLGLAKTLVLVAGLFVLYCGEKGTARQTGATEKPMSATECGLAALLAVALLFWTTDSLHHIAPAWIGMAAALVCLTPPFRLLPPRALQTINLEPVFYVGAIISLGALIAHAGLGQRLGAWVQQGLALSPAQPITDFVRLCGLSTIVGLLTTLPGVPAVLTPLTNTFAVAGGLSPATVLIAQVVGFSTLVLPYQAPPLVMAMQIANLPRREVARLSLITAGITIFILWPLDILWLVLLGRL